MNITEDYCSYEVAKLLKEKGFNEPIRCWYDNFQDFHEEGVRMSNTDCLPPTIMCPTHQMAMKWLRENSDITISIFPTIETDMIVREDYNYAIYKNKTVVYQSCSTSYEDAVEAALKYSLERLI